MRGKTVSQTVRRGLLGDFGQLASSSNSAFNGSGAEVSICSLVFTGKQIAFALCEPPDLTQQRDKMTGQHHIAIFGSLALVDSNLSPIEIKISPT